GARLVTVSGPPGVGKTRLAAEVLVRLPSPFSSGAFCDLTSIVEVEPMLHAIARAIDVTLTSSRSRADSLALLSAALVARNQTLVFLDNVDESLDAARSILAELLARSPGTSFVVTSRARLSLATERVHVLPPLATLHEAGKPTPAAALLFLECARRASEDAWDDPAALADVLAIVAALDGLPLAIELAAARTSLLAPHEILERLKEPLSLLEGPGRSLRAAIDASWRLLSPDERMTLAACSVIDGPFGVELMEETCRLLHVEAPVRALQSLRERSLLQLVGAHAGERRLRVFDSVRAFVAEALQPEERDRVLHAASAAGGAMARRCLEAAWGPKGPATLRTLLREEKAFEGLITSIVGRARPEPRLVGDVLELTSALIHLREEMGPADTVPALVRMVLAFAESAGNAGNDIDPVARAELEARAAGVLHRAADRDRARALAETAITRAQAAHAHHAEGLALLALAYGARAFGGASEVEAVLARARELARNHDDAVIGAATERAQADACQARLDIDGALSAIERAVAWAQRCADPRLESRAHLTWAVLLADRGDADAGREMALRMRGVCETADDRKGVGFAYVVAGACSLELGRRAEADALFVSAIAHGRRIGMPRLVAYALGFHAISLAEQRDFEGAERALAAAEDLLGPTAERVRVAAVRTARAALLALLGRLDEAHRIARMERTNDGDRDGVLARVLLHGVSIGDAARSLEQGDEAGAHARFGEIGASLERTKAAIAASSPFGRPPSAVLRLATRLAEQLLGAYVPPAGALVLYEKARAIDLPDGTRLVLANQPLMWRFCASLAAAHVRAPGTPMTRDELLASLWPGESILARAAKNRLAVTLHKLRKLGLDAFLVTSEGGTSLQPGTHVVFAHSRGEPGAPGSAEGGRARGRTP
ncbi:MAG: hypothetical protein JWM74_2562, partial [Myxococcaceae bacterium]|nr:hypothetical protein [Myxococcaceae bacterium]